MTQLTDMEHEENEKVYSTTKVLQSENMIGGVVSLALKDMAFTITFSCSDNTLITVCCS